MHQNRSLFSSEFSHSFTFQRAAMAIAAITNYDQMIKSLGKPTTQCTGLKRQESQKIRIISPNSMCNKSATNRSNGVWRYVLVIMHERPAIFLFAHENNTTDGVSTNGYPSGY